MKKIMKHKITVVALLILFLLIAWVGIDRYFLADADKLDSEMTKLVTEYYEKNIRGKVFGVNRHEITLEAIKSKGFINIDGLTKCDAKESKSYIIIQNPEETDVKKIKYTIENHLVCENYVSDASK